MRRRRFRKAVSVFSAAALTAALALGSVYTGGGATVEAEAVSGDVLAAFEDPDSDAKPMVRWWFSDSWAGEDDDDMIEEYIQELADAGYGGVEITLLASGTDMTSDQLAEYGWGTDSYVKLLKKALKAANAIEGGFTVDITITAHWPTVMSNIDPNDEEQQQELVYTTQAVNTSDDTSVSLTLPTTKLYDSTDALESAPFIFTDTLVDAYLVKSNDDGTYDYDSAICVTDYITSEAAYAAGVPDEEACKEWYGDDWETAYETVQEIYGEAPDDDADLSVSFNGKQDADGNRARMADTQYAYTLDTTKLSEDVQTALSNGEYTLVNTYSRGTGQVMSDGPFGGAGDSMYGRTYVTNYFSEGGTDAIIEYWEENILDDELRALLEENGSSIFEDSIEASTKSGGSFWSEDVVDRFAEDYGTDIAENLPLIVALSNQLSSSEISISDAQTSYQITLGNLYDEVHSAAISEWASTFGYSYRAQCYAVTGQDICGSEMATDIPEGDNSSKGDGLRKMASVVNVEDKESFSMEAVTATGNAQMNWADVVTEVAQNYSDGVNHVVLHGTPYAKSVTGYLADWPGWTAFGNNFAGSYAIWRADFDDMDNLTGYMARTQAVLQEGTAKVDLLFLNDTSTGASLNSGNTFQDLLNAGFSYNLTTEALLESDNAVVTNGVLAESGPAYKALVLNSVSQISSGAMETVVEYAEAGLPVVLYNCNISDIYGLETSDNTQAALLAAYEELLTYSNVKTVSSQEELSSALEELGVTSSAVTADGTEYLEISHYVDESNGSDYYYLFNNPEEAIAESSSVYDGKNATFKNGDTITTTVTLEGEGVPYVLDAWTGDVTPVAGYTVNDDGTVTVEVTVEGGESTIIALLNEKTASTYVTSADENVEYDSDGNIVYKSNEAGTVALTLSNGETVEITIDESLETLDLTSGWSLTIDSYGPSEDLDNEENIYGISTQGYTVYVDPTLTDIVTETFDIDTLCLWENISATSEQLEELGDDVESMDDVVGIGYYTNTFELPDGWTSSTGAVLNLEYSQDMIISVTVNGNVISVINNVTDDVDIGEYLQSGENTITIKMATPMFNRMEASGRMAIGLAGDMNMTGTAHIDHGITSVTLTPYTSVQVLEVIDDSDLAAAKQQAEDLLAALAEYQTEGSINADNYATVSDLISNADAAVSAYTALGGDAADLEGIAYLPGAMAILEAYEATLEDGNVKDYTDDGDSDDGNTDDGSTDDGNTDDGNTDDGSTDEGNTDDGSTDDGNTDDGSADDGSDDTDDGSDDTDADDDSDDADADDDSDSTSSGSSSTGSGSSSGSSSADSTDSTQTGDTSPIIASVLILCFAAAAILLVFFRRRKMMKM